LPLALASGQLATKILALAKSGDKAGIFYCLILQAWLEAIQIVIIIESSEMMKREVCLFNIRGS
jgi:hypothetical protein